MSPSLHLHSRLVCLLGASLLLLNCSSGSSGKTGAAGTNGSGQAGAGSGQAGAGSGQAGAGSGQAGAGSGQAGAGSGQAGAGSGQAGAGSGQAGATGAAGAAGGATGQAGAAGGATGIAGAAGANPTGAGGGVATGVAGAQGNSVTTRNNHETRDGFFIQPTLTKAKAATMALDTTFAATFSGGMWAAPLYLENGPNNKGVFFAVTQSDMVYALDETTGAIVWMHSFGTAPNAGSGFAGCGNDTGITSTPVIDVASRTIYLAGAVNGAGGTTHEIHALGVDDGMEKTGWPINVATLKGNGTLAFTSSPYNQRGALSLVNGILYVPYGGHVGDCGTYHGWVVAINASNPTMAAAWATSDTGGAIWAAGGMASNGDGVFATTGDGHMGNATHGDSEEVVHVTGMAQVNRTTGLFWPTEWRDMDQKDLDFGSVSPVVITVPGSTPSTLVAATAKHGHFYLLNPSNLGGMAGSLVDLVIADNGMSIRAAQSAYVSTTGVHVVMNASNTHCPMGMNGGVISVLVTPGNPPKANVAWCAGGGNQSPIATSTDGKNETIVWNYNGGLRGYDGDTGASVASPQGNCGNVRTWTSPIAVKGRIVVGGDGKLCSWSSH